VAREGVKPKARLRSALSEPRAVTATTGRTDLKEEDRIVLPH
jgi:hypothetical protein